VITPAFGCELSVALIAVTFDHDRVDRAAEEYRPLTRSTLLETAGGEGWGHIGGGWSQDVSIVNSRCS